MTKQLYNSKNKEIKSKKNKSSPPAKGISAIIRAYSLVESLGLAAVSICQSSLTTEQLPSIVQLYKLCLAPDSQVSCYKIIRPLIFKEVGSQVPLLYRRISILSIRWFCGVLVQEKQTIRRHYCDSIMKQLHKKYRVFQLIY